MNKPGNKISKTKRIFITGAMSLFLIAAMVCGVISYAEESLEEQKSQAESEVTALEAQLDEIFTAMTEIEEEMTQTSDMIDVATRSLEAIQIQENQQYAALKKRIKYFYEEGNDQLLVAFLEASDLADVYRRLEYVKSINAYDRALLDEYIQTRMDITALKEQLEEDNEYLQEEQRAYETQQAELSALIENKKEEIENLDQLIAEAEQRAREEAERKKALEEEARQRALADAENRKSSGNTGESTGGENSGTGSGGDSSGSGGNSGDNSESSGGGETGDGGGSSTGDGGNTGSPTKDTSNLWYSTMSTNEIYVYLINSGMTSQGAAGMLGNLYAESGLRSTNLENKYNSEFGLSDSEYTEGVDNGSYTNFINDKGGYGLAQWTYSTRKRGLYNYCVSCGASIGNAQVQMEYLVMELQNSYPGLWSTLCSTDDIKYASDCVLTQFEKPKNQSDSVKELRYNYALSLTQ